MPDLQRQYLDIDQKVGEIRTAQVILQPMNPKSESLLDRLQSIADVKNLEEKYSGKEK